MKWIPLKERLPPQDVCVLVAVYDTRKNVKMYFIRMAFRIGRMWCEPNDGEEMKMKNEIITHWMPLPDAPDVMV